MNLPSKTDKELFIKGLERFEITEQELNDAFWEAYADPYVPSTGTEFRHLWKHINKKRLGSGDKLYTYREMLNICHRESITTDHFEFIDKEQWKRK